MKSTTKRFPKYLQCPEETKRRIEAVFLWTLEHHPYPESKSIKEQIIWIHEMEEALRSIETESTILIEELPQWQNCKSDSRLVR